MSADTSAGDEGGRYVPAFKRKDVDDLTRAELRLAIQAKAGKRGKSHTPLTKETLNSVYAALTGEYSVEPRYLHRPDTEEFKPAHIVLDNVVIEAGIADGPDDPRWGGGSYAEMPDQLNLDELRQLYEEMQKRGNQMVKGMMGDGQE